MSLFDIASDLHLEHGPNPRLSWPSDPETKAKVDLLLAGDIGNIYDGSWLLAVSSAAYHYRHVYVVLGNHEFYSDKPYPLDSLAHKARTSLQVTVPNATLLDRETAMTPEGVRILGCTLWTQILKDERRNVEMFIQDYRRIWMSYERHMTVYDSTNLWQRDKTWLLNELASGPPAIVLTHHAPHPRLNPPQHARSPIKSAFVSHVPLPKQTTILSVSGHTHGRMSISTEEGVPCIAHCLGYKHEHDEPFVPRRITIKKN